MNSIHKDGVDPEQYCSSDYVNYKMTSDTFFTHHISKKYDIIFIDGLHTAYQVTVDIFNSIRNLNPGGFIVIDDVFPYNKKEQEALDLRRFGEPLTGDVWKAVYHVLDRLIDISSDIYFIKEVERGHLVLKIEDPSKNITIDPSIPTSNTDRYHPVEWNQYLYDRDFRVYAQRLLQFRQTFFKFR